MDLACLSGSPVLQSEDNVHSSQGGDHNVHGLVLVTVGNHTRWASSMLGRGGKKRGARNVNVYVDECLALNTVHICIIRPSKKFYPHAYAASNSVSHELSRPLILLIASDLASVSGNKPLGPFAVGPRLTHHSPLIFPPTADELIGTMIR